jgi:hypothetical protein
VRRIAIAAALGLGLLAAQGAQAPAQVVYPAGTTNAVLSYVDAAGGHVSVVRHWTGPGAGQDAQVVPFTPYFWDGCLPFQSGALMVLLTSPVGYPAPQLTSSAAYTSQYLASLSQAASAALSQAAASLPPSQAQAAGNLEQLAAQLTTPGDPAYELLKAAPLVNSLNAYEDYGYAVFMFVRWKWIYVPFPVPSPCAQVDVVSVPEGYGIPFVARSAGGFPTARAGPRWRPARVQAARRAEGQPRAAGL